MDLLVNLYSRRLDDLRQRTEGVEAVIRLALPPEQHVIRDWVREHFSEYWVSEVTAAMAHQPPGCLIATVEGKLVGFACYDATARGFFGPTGVSEDQRGKGIGVALFYHTLAAMKAHGYAYAVIGSAGPVDFYANAVGAIPITNSAGDENVYRGMLRIGRNPDGTE